MPSNIKQSNYSKVCIDIALSVLLIVEMLYSLTGNALHEILGAAFFVTLIVHIVFTRKWLIGALRTCKTKPRGIKHLSRLIVIACIVLSTLSLLFSSLMISNQLDSIGFSFKLGSVTYESWSTIHFYSAYALCFFALFHLALHWASAFRKLAIPYNPARREAINRTALGLAALGAVAVGIVCSKSVLTKELADTLANTGKSKYAEKSPQSDIGTDSERPEDKASGNSSAKKGAAKPGTSNSTEKSDVGNSGSNTKSTSTICTLCKKRCPLSAPKCNRPYDEGLI